MYNTKKVCSCGWSARYDNMRDTWGFGRYVYCPICAKELEDRGYSPDI